MVNFETEKNLIRKMFKEIDTVFENDGAGIEDTIKAKDVNSCLPGRYNPVRGEVLTELLGRPSFGPNIRHRIR